MLMAPHLNLMMKVALPLACLGMVALWPEWRAGLRAQDLSNLPPVCGNPLVCTPSSDCTQSCFETCEWEKEPGEKEWTCVLSTCGESGQCSGPGNCSAFCSELSNCGQTCTDKEGFTISCAACGTPPSEPGRGGGASGLEDLIDRYTGATWQSSTAFGGTSNRGVDFDTDGILANGSVTHTDLEDNPEWQVDLRWGDVRRIVVWNRTDCCAERLAGATVWVRNASNDHKWHKVGTLSGIKEKYVIDVKDVFSRPSSDRVAILRNGKQRYLSVAEVQVQGPCPARC
jgi:hypothetical protein